jgi:arginyl-tRNA synthetase
MLPSQSQTLLDAITRTLAPLAGEVPLPAITLEQPKDPSHGDVACTAALACAKALKKNPREVAQTVVDGLKADPAVAELIASMEIAGPGFINFRIAPAARQAVVREVLDADHKGANFGAGQMHAGKHVMVEFVSANPTGPLHVGHTRQAAIGDVLCNLLANQGAQVTREFYYNDAGNQIANLALSVQARLKGLTPESPGWPADGYAGGYIIDIANDFSAKKTVSASDGEAVTASGDIEDLEGIRRFAVTYLRREQDGDLRAFGLKFDVFYLESSLYSDGRVEETVAKLKAAGMTYEQDGALFLRTTAIDAGERQDDKDRVMRKREGGYTYFVPDVAYHWRKWERGFAKVINVQGTDHFGTIPRVRAGLQGLDVGIPKNYPDYVLHSMVKVMRGGEEVKVSKRKGGYVTMSDLIEWVGRDAVRYFMVSRKADSEFVFDLDLALAKSDENPVYYIQYAHARICSVAAKVQAEKSLTEADVLHTDLSPLTAPKELQLMAKLAEFGPMLEAAAANHAPHTLAHWLKDCAAAFHGAYNAERVLVDDEPTMRARLALYAATRRVLARGLAILGMSAPDRMDREETEPAAATAV